MDPLVKSVRKVRTDAKKTYQASRRYEIDQLLAERSRWQRKLTIASNKLAWVQREIERTACKFAEELEGKVAAP